MMMMSNVLVVVVVVVGLLELVAGAARVGDYVYTPFGLRHFESILRIPSGTSSRVEQIDGLDHLYLSFPNGTEKIHPPSPHAVPTASKRDTPNWNGWMEHYWFGAEYSFFTNPALTSGVKSFHATWNVPAVPIRTSGNSSAPWGYEPTLSFWPGLQSSMIDTVIQPVLEFNGLEPGYDLASWNCCPAGYVLHSDPITGLKPGDVVTGSMVSSTSHPYLFTITAGVNGKSTSLVADFTSQKIVFDWAVIFSESYFVTSCYQLPHGGVNFNVTTFTTFAGSVVPSSLPWRLKEMMCTGSSCPIICDGQNTKSGATVSIKYEQ